MPVIAIEPKTAIAFDVAGSDERVVYAGNAPDTEASLPAQRYHRRIRDNASTYSAETASWAAVTGSP